MHSINRIDFLHKAVEWPVARAIDDAVTGAVWGTVHQAVWRPVNRAVDVVGWNAEFWALEDPDHPGLEDFLRSVEA